MPWSWTFPQITHFSSTHKKVQTTADLARERHIMTPPDHWFPRGTTSEERAQKFLIMTCPFQDLGSACDWLKQIPSWHVISMEFLYSFLWRHFAVKPLMASRNVSCFLRLWLQYNEEQVCVVLACSRLSYRGGRRKRKMHAKSCRPCSSQFPPVLFSCLPFLNSADPTISEPGTG